MKKIVLLFIVAAAVFSFCTLDLPEDPKPPKWNVEIERIPIFKADTLRLGDQLKPDDFNRLGADSVLSININSEQSFNLKDKLKIPGRSTSFSDQLGNFEISVEQSAESDILFAEMFPELSGMLGAEAVIDTMDLNPVENHSILEDFDSVRVVSGRVRYDVTNNLGFVLSGDVRLAILDEGRADVPIDTLFLERMENGETSVYYTDLAGKWISSQIKTVILGTSNGSEGETVFIPETSGVHVVITPETFIVSEAFARLTEQTLSLSGEVDVSTDSLTVKQAEIESGTMSLTIENRFDFTINLVISIPSIMDVSQNILELDMTIGVGESRTETLTLDQHTLDMNDGILEFGIELKILPEADQKYALKGSDEIFAEIEMSDIQLESVIADFFMTTGFPDIEETVFEDRPEDFTNLSFQDVRLEIGFIDPPFDLGLALDFTGQRIDSSYTIHVHQNITSSNSLVLDKDGVNGDMSSPTIVDLINMIPEKIIVSGDVRLIGDNVSFHKDDEIGVAYAVDFPLIFATENASYSKIDTLKIAEGTRENLVERSVTASLNVSLENGLPISGSLALYTGIDSLDISDEIFTIVLPQATVDVEGIVIEPGEGMFTIDMNETTIQALANGYYYKFIISLDDTGVATLTANDYIVVRDVFVSGKFLFDPDGM